MPKEGSTTDGTNSSTENDKENGSIDLYEILPYLTSVPFLFFYVYTIRLFYISLNTCQHSTKENNMNLISSAL